jgi:hypothetical protein
MRERLEIRFFFFRFPIGAFCESVLVIVDDRIVIVMIDSLMFFIQIIAG